MADIKYKLSELAKDFGYKPKEFLELIKDVIPDRRLSSSSSFNEQELDKIFVAVTQKKSVTDLKDFFENAHKSEAKPVDREEKKPEPKKTEKASVKTEQTVKKPVKAEKTEKTEKAEKPGKPVKKDKPAKAADGEKKPVNNNKKPQNNSAKSAAKKEQKPAPAKATASDEPKFTQTSDSFTRPGRRTVDTRTTHVELDKYNEKYDMLASEKVKVDNTVRKVKLNQKSQQYKKPKGMRKQQRESEQQRLQRIEEERKKKQLVITIPEELTVGDLARRANIAAGDIIKKLIKMGMMISINDVIDFDTAFLVASEFHVKVEPEVVVTIEERIIDDSEDDDTNLVPRSPVVVVMGHVDHGKTSILDAIRSADVASGEAGGITQHIGAYRVDIGGEKITFLDTPGHEAFTTMRARGASVTDIAVLVVAADDGIMPQTVEAINHAKAANVSIIVAINKMDKDGANPDHVKQQLTEYELVPEEWGGDVICVPVSAKTKQGIDTLLENILLVAEMNELKANPDRAAKGTVIEARRDKGRGTIATILVQNGTLHTGDIVVAGTSVGRVRAMMNDRGERVKEAGPSVPVEITGLDEVPAGGDVVNAVSDERLARELVEQRRQSIKEEQFKQQNLVTLDNLFDRMKEGEVKELKIIVKADVNGSVEAVKQSLVKLSNDEVKVNVIHGGVGAINESDVMLANASDAIIVGFNVRPDPAAADNAATSGVDIRLYRIIYECIEEIESAMKGMLAPKYREVDLGRAEVRQVLKISSVGTVSGSYVLSGKITRSAQIRVVRDGAIITVDQISSLRRFKDDVKEVKDGFECGITLEKFNDIKEGDIFEAFIVEEYRED